MDPSKMIKAALVDLEHLAGPDVVGLVVEYRGSEMRLIAVTPDDPQRDSTEDYLWEAHATADPIDDGPEECSGRGMTAIEALDACADAVEEAERDPSDDDESESEVR